MNNPYYSAQHPDELLNQRMTKQPATGSRQAAEDAAIKAYIDAYEKLGEEQAGKIYFETYQKYLHVTTRHEAVQ